MIKRELGRGFGLASVVTALSAGVAWYEFGRYGDYAGTCGIVLLGFVLGTGTGLALRRWPVADRIVSVVARVLAIASTAMMVVSVVVSMRSGRLIAIVAAVAFGAGAWYLFRRSRQ